MEQVRSTLQNSMGKWECYKMGDMLNLHGDGLPWVRMFNIYIIFLGVS